MCMYVHCVVHVVHSTNGNGTVKVDTKESYLEIDVAIFVHVECAENVIAKFFRVAGWEEHFIHVDEFCRR